MKNLLTSQLSGRTLLRLLLVFFCLCSLQITQGYAANLIDVRPIHSTNCDNGTQQCCYDIHITLDGTTDGLADFTPFSPNCWNWTCFNSQSVTISNDGSGATGTLSKIMSNGIQTGFSISFSTAPSAGATVDLLLCPKDPLPAGCTIVGQTFSWHTSNGGVLNGSGSGTFNACGDFVADCLGCDQTIIYRPDDCHQNVCYKRRATSGAGTHSFRFHFDPCLASCTPSCNPPYTSSDPSIATTCYSISTIHRVGGCIDYIDVSPNPSCSTALCDEICLSIPTCGTRNNITVKAVDLSDSLNCSPNPKGTFKIGTGKLDNSGFVQGESNYPNPVTSASNFKTVVPFSIPVSSEARIIFVDQTGKVVHTESQNFEGAGKHFFYLTASDLPSGSYYYTIESPLGVPIVKRNLLIVK